MKISAARAEYMELKDAIKDDDCEKVEVKGGVSRDRGCCDKFEPEDKDVTQFRCGTCEYLTSNKGFGNDNDADDFARFPGKLMVKR